MAAAAKSAQKSAAHKTPQPKHTAPAPRPAPKAASAPKPKPTPKHEADEAQARPTAKAASPASKPKPAPAPAPTQSHDDPAADDAAANASAEAATAVKGRAPARPAGKNAAPHNATAATKARDAAADPGADEANQSGLSLLQLLAQSLTDADSEATSTDTAAAPPATGKASDGETDKSSEDPNAIALAMLGQALAAALVGQQTPAANTADKGDGASAIGTATQSPGGAASMQDIMTVLARDVGAGAQSNSDEAAAQFNVDPTKGGAAGSATDPTSVAPNALAHLGVASHFAAQHLRNEANSGELRAPVGSSDWNDELGTHLTWMTTKGLETGSLRVSPEHLGPVEVNISVQNGAASVWFAANHADTRAALEQALPRLREMFASQGMNLADSGVSRQSLAEQGSRDRGRSGASQSVSGVSAVAGADGTSATASRINLGLVDPSP